MQLEARFRHSIKRGWYGTHIRLTKTFTGLTMPFQGKFRSLKFAHIQLFSDNKTKNKNSYMFNIVRGFDVGGTFNGGIRCDISQIRMNREDLTELRDVITALLDNDLIATKID